MHVIWRAHRFHGMLSIDPEHVFDAIKRYSDQELPGNHLDGPHWRTVEGKGTS